MTVQEPPPVEQPNVTKTTGKSARSFTVLDPPLENVYPPRKRQPFPDKDARTLALETFADFLSTLVFRRTGDKGGKPVPFRIRREDIHVEQPDHVRDLKFPSIAFMPGQGQYIEFGLGEAHILDDTFDLYAPGTVVIEPAEYEEQFVLEVTGAKSAERRAVVAGIEAAMLSRQHSYALRLRLPNYFNSTATFALESRLLVESEAQRNRRVAQMTVTLGVCMAQLINATELQPFVSVDDC